MYVRYDGRTPVFVPEDGRRPTSTMLDPVRDADPTKLKRGVCLQPLQERVHNLIVEFFSGKLERCDKREKALIRFFLTKVNAARLAGLRGNPTAQSCSQEHDKADGNPDNIYLSIRRGLKPMTFELYANIRGVGCVETLPRLSMDGTDALARIYREAMPKHVATVPDFMPAGSTEPSRGRVVPKTEPMKLIPAQ
jgi:hypothetical protein